MAEIFVCVIVLWIIGIFSKKPDDQKNHDLIIPILPESEFDKEDYYDNADSMDFDCEGHDLFDDYDF